MVIAIGCTGGQHRSVALAKRLAEYLNEIFEYNVYVHHRDAHIESERDNETNERSTYWWWHWTFCPC